MSIATLKKHADARYFQLVSHNNNGFALNGTLRPHKYVGPTDLGSCYPGTPFTRYQGPQGHGGSHGKYPIAVTKTNGAFSCCNNDPNVIKRSHASTRTYLTLRKRREGQETVQPDSNRPEHHSSSYFTRERTRANQICNLTLTNAAKRNAYNNSVHQSSASMGCFVHVIPSKTGNHMCFS